MKKDIHIVNLKKQKESICRRTTFYSIFNMSSCRKSKNTKWFGLNHPNQLNLVLLFLTNSGQKSLNMLILSFLTTVQLVVFKDREI